MKCSLLLFHKRPVNMAKNCGVCNRRILSHSRVLKCSNCYCELHISCCNITANESALIKDWLCIMCISHVLPFNHLDDDNEFKSALQSLASEVPLDFEALDKLIFNPFEWNYDVITPMNELDPDLQYFSHSCFSNNYLCDYHTEETFNNYTTKHKINSGLNISIYAHNVRSLPKHDTELRSFLSGLDTQIEIIGLTESWLNENNKDLFGLDGYFKPKLECQKR